MSLSIGRLSSRADRSERCIHRAGRSVVASFAVDEQQPVRIPEHPNDHGVDGLGCRCGTVRRCVTTRSNSRVTTSAGAPNDTARPPSAPTPDVTSGPAVCRHVIDASSAPSVASSAVEGDHFAGAHREVGPGVGHRLDRLRERGRGGDRRGRRRSGRSRHGRGRRDHRRKRRRHGCRTRITASGPLR